MLRLFIFLLMATPLYAAQAYLGLPLDPAPAQ